MGLFGWLRRILGGGEQEPAAANSPGAPATASVEVQKSLRRPHRRIRLEPLRFRSASERDPGGVIASKRPYRFGRPSIHGGWLDLSQDQNDDRLQRLNLPPFRNPEELAAWLEIPLGQL